MARGRRSSADAEALERVVRANGAYFARVALVNVLARRATQLGHRYWIDARCLQLRGDQ